MVTADLPDTFMDTPAEGDAEDLLRQLHAQTRPSPKNGARPPLYNAPDLWYARPDGDVVKLQGDAASQAYYRSKGFHILTPDEVQRWETGVRRAVIQMQRRRATLITTLRRISARHPGVDIVGDLDITPVEELETMLNQLKQITGGNVSVVMGRFREEDVPVDDPQGAILASGAELEFKLNREAAREAAASRSRSAGGRFVAEGAKA